MSFKETKVAKLDKEEVRQLKELDTERLEHEKKLGAFRAKQKAFWDGLVMKHTLCYSNQYYIKNGCIYTQELEEVKQ